MRFQKMRELEERSIVEYQALLEECKSKYKNERTLQKDLEQLITDEKKHAKLVQELLKITGAQSDE